MASNNVAGGKKRPTVINDNTKENVRCLHSSLTLLFRHFFFSVGMIMKAAGRHGFTEPLRRVWAASGAKVVFHRQEIGGCRRLCPVDGAAFQLRMFYHSVCCLS